MPARPPVRPTEPPVSLTTVHKYCIATADRISADVRHFRNRYRIQDADYQKCVETAKEILSYMGEFKEEITSMSAFEILMADDSVTENVRNQPEFNHLTTFCDRSKAFTILYQKVKKIIIPCVRKYLSKYCISFGDQEYTGEVGCIQDYKYQLKEYSDSLDESIKMLDTSWKQYNETKTPFIDHLSNGEQVNEAIIEMCNKILHMCSTIHAWAKEDKAYPGILWTNLVNWNKERQAAAKKYKIIDMKCKEIQHLRRRNKIALDSTKQKLDPMKKEMKRYKTGIEVVSGQLEKAETERERKEFELQEVVQKIETRQSNSPMYLAKLWEQQDSVQLDIKRMETRKENYLRQIARYEKLEKKLANNMVNVQNEYDRKKAECSDLEQQHRELQARLHECKEQLEGLEQSIAVAKRIRQQKMDAKTLRRLHNMKEGSKTTDNLTTACQLVAKSIGKEWRTLYKVLPFAPPRDHEKRSRDVELLDTIGAHWDVTLEEQATQCLARWRLFNRSSNIQQLVKSLNRIEKPQIARRVEVKFLKCDTA